MARQPEPDLEFTEEELDQTISTRPASPMKSRKKSGGGRSTLWILLLVLVAGVAYYVAMEPEMLNEWLAPYLGETTPPAQPPVAMKPRPTPPAPAAPAPAPAPESTPAPSATPVTPGAMAPPAPTAAAPAPSAPVRPAPAPVAAAPTTANLSPMFAEGQKVTAVADPTNPSQTVTMSLDAVGSKPGPVIRPGSTLTVLDGDLQPTGWVYQVRNDDGSKGWVSEKRLRLKF